MAFLKSDAMHVPRFIFVTKDKACIISPKILKNNLVLTLSATLRGRAMQNVSSDCFLQLHDMSTTKHLGGDKLQKYYFVPTSIYPQIIKLMTIITCMQ